LKRRKGRRIPIKNNLKAIRLSFEMADVSLLFKGNVVSGIQVT